MEIKVKCRCGEEKCKEWAIVELQGVVEVQPEFQDSFRTLPMAKLCRPSSQENYTFSVGYHELSGSKVPLKKPFLVMKKIKHSIADKDGGDTSSVSKVELEVIGIVRHRILFKNRPKALISSSQPVVKAKLSAPGSVAHTN
ncbi:Ctf8 domain-containing protein [Heracleum sosnowskyi]|uniref:Ctf8 domain-containing protein n=1 Tax=Heracleum sosnowskyi TaxID=360622 RepID=A0AAD8IV70_9APIA|nr:Ctf8 domain-containing protein [Heracleum sosnowskyi]